jgi:DNA-binding NtrC family response regulator
MKEDSGRPLLDHPGMREPPYGAAAVDEMAATDVTDQEKLAFVLQGAALLAHAGLARQVFGPPGEPWREAAIGRDGRLHVGPGRPGAFGATCQQLLSALLLRLFHSHGQVAGRGVARKAARLVLAQWSQELVPLRPDRAILQIFEAAPFLWSPDFGLARQALAASLERPGDARRYLLVAGPGGARRRFQQEAPTLESLLALLAGPRAREIFEGAGEESDPLALEAAGHPLRAAAAWRRRPPRDEAEKMRCGAVLLGLGRGLSAAEVLEGLAAPAARLLRARALLAAGQRHAAEKALQFEAALFPALAVEKADIEIRLLGGRGELEAIRRKIVPLLALAAERPPAPGMTERLRLEIWLVAAAAAWDCGDRAATEGYLEAARDGAGEGDLAWRYHQLRALAAQEVGDGLRATLASQAALAGRRRMSRDRAGRLWNDLAVSRVLAGDLPAAERAARHAFRLLESGDGAGALAMALSNLAEVRLRRGRFAGVEATLERSIAHNRLAGNSRGLLRDLETTARLELGLGRPAAALARCAEAFGHPEAAAARQDVFQLFAARAHGWLGRSLEAAACLDLGGAAALGELEPEERPAILALAGRGAEALREAHGTPWQDLWRDLAALAHPPLEAWQALATLEPYRAARMVFDAERLLPGVAPRQLLRRALATLREAGAEAMAEQIDAGGRNLASALETYAKNGKVDLEAGRLLMEQAGYGNVPVYVRGDDGRFEKLWGEGDLSPLPPSPQTERGEDFFGGVNPSDSPERKSTRSSNGSSGEREGRSPSKSGSPPSPSAERGAGGRGPEIPKVELVFGVKDPDPALAALFALLKRDLAPALAALSGAPAPAKGFAADEETPFAADGIVGRDPSLIAAVRRLDALATSEVSVLILGESGSGKELFARRLHRKSRRAQGPFLAVNCAALSESLILSDLFGHVRGGFTGADRDRAGIFESARGGTVFLDEIGDLPLSCQGHLLRVLQENEIRRVGESFARKVDVRVITATHRDLEQEVAAGRFRLDLFYRLRAASVILPPLRHRLGDLFLLASHFLARLPPPKKNLRLSKDALAALAAYPWPGNIRELKNIVEVAAALAEGADITPAELELPAAESADIPPADFAGLDYHQQIEAFRRRLVVEALAAAGGQRSEAARRLGLSRQALSYLIRQLGIL